MGPADVGHNVAQASHEAGTGVLNELGKLGKTVLSQIFGTDATDSDLTHHEIKGMVKKDEEFGEKAYEQQRAKIRAIYEQYYAQKRRQKQLEEQEEEKEKQEEKMEEINAQRVAKNRMGVEPQIAKTRAEIKNYGAE